jgi:tetratricopeptide (TPR) repeat protein
MDHLTGPLCRVEASTTHTKLSKAKYAQQQQFSKEFHAYSSKQQDFAAVYAWGMHKLESTPEENKWGVYYELAKLCRERDQHEQAGAMFAKLTEMQPDFINGWLDHVKCEEVAGNLNFAVSVLVEGIRHNPCNEHLAIRLLKLVEKMEDGVGAQQVCDFIGRSDPASTWKSWLQMALFKSRRGLVNEAARIMHFLVDKLPRNGVISNEAAKLEASLGHYPEAFEICHRGMEQSSRYGLLWFTYLRLFCINKANASLADKWADVSIASIVQRAQQNLSADLLWKIHFEAAQMKASLGDFAASEVWFKKSGSTCPSSLQWKVLLGNSRMKLRWGAAEVKKYKRRSTLTDRHFCDAQVLISESLSCCPQKMKSTVLIECAHLEEFMGNPTRAKQLLGDARCKGKSAWRAALEEILLHLRQQDHASALTHAKQALQEYPFTGRLWGLLIQLLELEGPDAQLACFHEAVQQVPKSGEVWSAGARLALNPTSPHFNLDQAIARLNKSIKFTPQFGDSFIDSTLHALLREGVGHARESAISDISRKCIAADPNYGTQWFRAMSSGPGLCMPGVSAGDVLAQAHVSLVEDLHTFRHVYQAALIGSQASAQDTQAWREGHHNALQRMHPNTQQLAMPDRYELLFGCDSLSA